VRKRRRLRKEVAGLEQDKADVAEERLAAKGVLHEVADLIFTIQAAAERMERLVKELAEEEKGRTDDDRPDEPGEDQ
jgi:hypothetical protein